MYGLARNLSPSEVHAMAAGIRLPAFVPKQGLKIATTEAEQSQQQQQSGGMSIQDAENNTLTEMLHALPPPASLQGKSGPRTINVVRR